LTSDLRTTLCAIFLLVLPVTASWAQQAASAPLPAIPQLMREVEAHQKQLDKVRENYTYTSLETTQDLDANGSVTKTESKELEVFFVNGHAISHLVKKDGKPLSDDEQKKESERVTKEIEKAQQPDAEKPKQSDDLTVSRILEIIDVSNPRRAIYRGRATIVFDVAGRKDAKTHGMQEEAFKKIQGTVWIDEVDREVAHVDIAFSDNFHIAGGLVANIEKGSRFSYDQALVNGEIWLPAVTDATVQLRLFLVKNMRQHIVDRQYDYKRFNVETVPGKEVMAVAEKP